LANQRDAVTLEARPLESAVEMSIAEARLESIKGGSLSAIAVGLVAGITLISVTLLRATDAINLPLPLPQSLLEWLVNIAVALCSGFFFGVSYRYIVRQDPNLHLGGGAVGAFALVRSLAQIEATWSGSFTFLTWLLITGESFLWFAVARYTLDWAMASRLIKPL
jgi:hypothetical protein